MIKLKLILIFLNFGYIKIILNLIYILFKYNRTVISFVNYYNISFVL